MAPSRKLVRALDAPRNLEREPLDKGSSDVGERRSLLRVKTGRNPKESQIEDSRIEEGRVEPMSNARISSDAAVSIHRAAEDTHHLCLMRLHEAARLPQNPIAQVAACRRELSRALPILTQHAAEEEDALKMRNFVSSRAALEVECVIAQSISTLRELRTVLDTANRMIEDDAIDSGSTMSALCSYLMDCVEDLLRHEACGCPVGRRGIAA